MKTYQEIVEDIKKSKGANVVKANLNRLAITEANGGQEKVTIEIDKTAIKRVVVDAEGNASDTDVNFCNLSAIGFWGALRETKLKAVLKKIRRDYDLLDILLDGAVIEITQILVPKNTPYTNPFSEDTTKTAQWDVPKYISFVTNITLSKEGEADLKQMKKYMLMGIKE